MTNRSTCCHTQTSLFCLQKTEGGCQADTDNITFCATHKTWNAIYRKGSFQNMALLAVKRTEQSWSPAVSGLPSMSNPDTDTDASCKSKNTKLLFWATTLSFTGSYSNDGVWGENIHMCRIKENSDSLALSSLSNQCFHFNQQPAFLYRRCRVREVNVTKWDAYNLSHACTLYELAPSFTHQLRSDNSLGPRFYLSIRL